MATLGNVLWFILFGWWQCISFFILGVIYCITIIGIPVGKACFQFAKLSALPYGKDIVRETFIKGKENVSAVRRVGGVIANILWLPFGLFFALAFATSALICTITIILIPMAVVCARMAKFILWPVGAKVILKDEARAIRLGNHINQDMQQQLNALQGANGMYPAPGQGGYIQPMVNPLTRTEEEQKREAAIINSGGWRCTKCRRVNYSFTNSCGCGLTRDESEILEREKARLRLEEIERKSALLKKPVEAVSGAEATDTGRSWRCAGCGTVNEGTRKNCRYCGGIKHIVGFEEVEDENKPVDEPKQEDSLQMENIPLEVDDTSDSEGGTTVLMSETVVQTTAQITITAPEETSESMPVAETEKKFCIYCGASLDKTAKFCHICGALTEPKKTYRFCTQCGMKQDAGNRFCLRCGKSL